MALVDDDEIEVVDERSLRKQGTMSAEMQLKPLEGDLFNHLHQTAFELSYFQHHSWLLIMPSGG